MESFHYRLQKLPLTHRPGAHLGQSQGESGLYAGTEPLQTQPARRFDLRATLFDPWQRLHVQRFQSRSQVTLVAVVDLSRSMRPKLDLLGRLITSIAYSAYAHHDRFSLWLATDRPLCVLPPRRLGGMVALVERSLQEVSPQGRAFDALLDIAAQLPRASLIFLISDFFLSDRELETLASTFGRYDTVPVVVWSKEERELPGRYGWLRLRDPESGRERMLFLRPKIAEAFRERVEKKKRRLGEIFRPYGRPPLFLKIPFSAPQLTEYFQGGS